MGAGLVGDGSGCAAGSSWSGVAMAAETRPLTGPRYRPLDAYWRAANYLAVGQIYLMANPLLAERCARQPQAPRAARLLGHWALPRPEPRLRAHLGPGHRGVPAHRDDLHRPSGRAHGPRRAGQHLARRQLPRGARTAAAAGQGPDHRLLRPVLRSPGGADLQPRSAGDTAAIHEARATARLSASHAGRPAVRPRPGWPRRGVVATAKPKTTGRWPRAGTPPTRFLDPARLTAACCRSSTSTDKDRQPGHRWPACPDG